MSHDPPFVIQIIHSGHHLNFLRLENIDERKVGMKKLGDRKQLLGTWVLTEKTKKWDWNPVNVAKNAANCVKPANTVKFTWTLKVLQFHGTQARWKRLD